MMVSFSANTTPQKTLLSNLTNEVASTNARPKKTINTTNIATEAGQSFNQALKNAAKPTNGFSKPNKTTNKPKTTVAQSADTPNPTATNPEEPTNSISVADTTLTNNEAPTATNKPLIVPEAGLLLVQAQLQNEGLATTNTTVADTDTIALTATIAQPEETPSVISNTPTVTEVGKKTAELATLQLLQTLQGTQTPIANTPSVPETEASNTPALPAPTNLPSVNTPISTEPQAFKNTQEDTTNSNNPNLKQEDATAFLSNDKKRIGTTKDNTEHSQPERFTPLTTALDLSATSAVVSSASIPTNLPVTTDVAVTDLHAVAAQVGGKLESLVANNNLATGARQVSMVLQPEALGNVRIQLQQHSGTQAISGKIVVQTPEALTALTQQFDGLKAQLEGQGITLQKLDIVLAPPTDTTVLESQQHQAMLAVGNGGDTFSSSNDTGTDNHNSKEFNGNQSAEDEPFSQQAGNNSGFDNKQEASGFSQQARKEAYQTHLNELRGLRSYRAALQGNNSPVRYNG